MTNFKLADTLWRQGFSVIPLLPDGKRPALKWKKFQTQRATRADLALWFGYLNYKPAIVTGVLSDITVIDCDSPAAIDAAILAGMTACLLTQVTKRGKHYIFRHAGERNTVRVNGLAHVDRRGQGGYIKAYDDAATWSRDVVNQSPTISE